MGGGRGAGHRPLPAGPGHHRQETNHEGHAVPNAEHQQHAHAAIHHDITNHPFNQIGA